MLSEMEKTALDMLLEGEDDRLAVLRRQLDGVGVVNREFSGTGFFTHLSVASSVPRLDPKQAQFHTASWHQPPEFRRHGSPFRPTVVVDLILDWLCPLLTFPFVADFRGGRRFPPCPSPRLAA